MNDDRKPAEATPSRTADGPDVALGPEQIEFARVLGRALARAWAREQGRSEAAGPTHDGDPGERSRRPPSGL